jgi:hypothetical protein
MILDKVRRRQRKKICSGLVKMPGNKKPLKTTLFIKEHHIFFLDFVI